jgi:hypothetical protein
LTKLKTGSKMSKSQKHRNSLKILQKNVRTDEAILKGLNSGSKKTRK